jgi:drug/metabolite transporter (DMT)-like permease
MQFLFWAVAGWCGTPWRKWPPPPNPDPWWWVVKVAAVIGGVVGGILTDRYLTGVDAGPVRFVVTLIGAALVGRVVAEVTSEIGNRSRMTA